jgi:predicted ATPase/class 3 adenylate cyclase
MLFTDIEGSTQAARALGGAWSDVLGTHHGLLQAAIESNGGFVERTDGDAFFVVFEDPAAAARAAVAAQRSLRSQPWPEAIGELRVRMGLHVGHIERNRTGYFGLEVHRAARVADAGHGGQLLMTGAARALAADAVRSEPLGLFRLKDFPTPEPLFCAVIDGRGPSAFPPPRTPDVRPTNLPPATTRLVGREGALELVRRALVDGGERLLTLTGRGGAGKTSVALAAAAALLDDHPGGVWLVALAGVVESADAFMRAVASAIGAEGNAAESVQSAVVDRLRSRGPVLLVIDNFEHVLAAAKDAARLLEALPELRILATSQVPLHLTFERCLPLDGLDDAAALALIELTTERSGVALADGRDALLDVVRLLDGLPLALELAAARLDVLSPVELRDRLAASPALLRDRSADRPERQRSLRATVEWTLDALGDEPRALFVRMGAFAGPVELREIEAVAGGDGLDVLDGLEELLDIALVRRVERGDERLRFGLPEALRQIAAEQLDSATHGQRWRRAHAERQLEIAWAARFGNMTAGRDFYAAVAAEAEAAAALRWARAAGEPTAAPLAAAAVLRHVDLGRVRDAIDCVRPLVRSPTGDPAIDALAQLAHAYLLIVLGDTRAGRAAAERGLALAPDPATRTFGHCVIGFIETAEGRLEAGVRENERATACAREAGPVVTAYALCLEAQAQVAAGALELGAERLAEAERVGGPPDVKLLWHKDTIYADLAMKAGRVQEALGHYARSLIAAEGRGDDLQVLFDLQGLANALATLERDRDAVEVFGLAEGLTAQMSDVIPAPVEHLFGMEPLAAAQQRLGPQAVGRCKALGREHPAARRVARACELARAGSPP